MHPGAMGVSRVSAPWASVKSLYHRTLRRSSDQELVSSCIWLRRLFRISARYIPMFGPANSLRGPTESYRVDYIWIPALFGITARPGHPCSRSNVHRGLCPKGRWR